MIENFIKKTLLVSILSIPILLLSQNTNNVDTNKFENKIEKVAVRPAVDGVFDAPGGKKQAIYKRTPIRQIPIREADGMWQKSLYRFIDIREKVNLGFYYPTVPMGDRISLCDIMKYSTRIDTGLVKYRTASLRSLYGEEDVIPAQIPAYTSEFCDYPFTYKEIIRKFGYTKKSNVYDAEGNIITDSSITTIEPLTSQDIIGYEIKEYWFFDKQRSVLDKRVTAIRPVFEYEKDVVAAPIIGTEGITPPTTEDVDDDTDKEVTFGPWFYFPELRPFLSSAEVYNPANEMESKSFDDMFWKRKFNAVIKAEGNALNDRKINEYILYGLDQVLESERIKDQIRNYEHELWEF